MLGSASQVMCRKPPTTISIVPTGTLNNPSALPPPPPVRPVWPALWDASCMYVKSLSRLSLHCYLGSERVISTLSLSLSDYEFCIWILFTAAFWYLLSDILLYLYSEYLLSKESYSITQIWNLSSREFGCCDYIHPLQICLFLTIWETTRNYLPMNKHFVHVMLSMTTRALRTLYELHC